MLSFCTRECESSSAFGRPCELWPVAGEGGRTGFGDQRSPPAL
jgi:hypothetical protein